MVARLAATRGGQVGRAEGESLAGRKGSEKYGAGVWREGLDGFGRRSGTFAVAGAGVAGAGVAGAAGGYLSSRRRSGEEAKAVGGSHAQLLATQMKTGRAAREK